MPAPSQLLNDLLSLPATERAKLAIQLIESLDDQDDENVDEAWEKEIARRITEIDRREVTMIPWAEIRQIIRDENQPHES